MDAEAFKQQVVRHILNGSTETYAITPKDDARIRQLAQERFANWDCIYGANPKFNIDRTGRFAGGKMQFRMDIQKGVIRSAAVNGVSSLADKMSLKTAMHHRHPYSYWKFL